MQLLEEEKGALAEAEAELAQLQEQLAAKKPEARLPSRSESASKSDLLMVKVMAQGPRCCKAQIRPFAFLRIPLVGNLAGCSCTLCTHICIDTVGL